MPSGQQSKRALKSGHALVGDRSPYVEQVGPNQFRVGTHYVELGAETECHCGDHLFRNRPCKHIKAARALAGRDYLKRGEQ